MMSKPEPTAPDYQAVLNVAQRDPFFRKWMIEQLDAIGDQQDVGTLRVFSDPVDLSMAASAVGQLQRLLNCFTGEDQERQARAIIVSVANRDFSGVAREAAEKIMDHFLTIEIDELPRKSEIISIIQSIIKVKAERNR